MKTIDAVIEQCEEIANASKQHTLHMTHFSQSYDEWAEEWIQLAEWLKELKAYREGLKESRSEIPNTCGDAISRQEALNAITMAEVRWQAVDNVNKLPSVSPQQRTGRWIINRDSIGRKYGECSECMLRQYVGLINYCPNCGAKMEVEE